MSDLQTDPICGIWISPDAEARICRMSADGSRYELKTAFEPFVWTSSAADTDSLESLSERLEGPKNAPLDMLLRFPSRKAYDDFAKQRDKNLPFMRIPSLENQFLLSRRLRMFSGVRYCDLRILSLDIETHSADGSFSNPSKREDRILAFGLRQGGESHILELDDYNDESERQLILKFRNLLLELDPDIIVGHNIFQFDLNYISRRASILGVKLDIGRFGAAPSFRKTRIKIAERTFEYQRCDIPGRTVADTLILAQLYDISQREMPSYSLKECALFFDISSRKERTYITGSDIKDVFKSDRKRFRAYLSDDLRETEALAAIFLPTYIAQIQNIPMTLQECMLRGTGAKVEYLFLERYLARKARLPDIPPSRVFGGALSASYEVGVFRHVLHYDVASLYPSIMIYLGKCPKNDYLKVFIEILRGLREERLKYKLLAKTSPNPDDRLEYSARQNSFKILINSFYGYLGLSTARFGDCDLAEEITATGREILNALMGRFRDLGCRILEADTDGIYISAPEYFDDPHKLLDKVSDILPAGIELDFDGKYPSMLCYKAKNYALVEDGKMRLKGSALRSRAMEPYLKDISNEILKIELGLSKEDLSKKLLDEKRRIESGEYPVERLAKSEYISLSPSAYEAEILRAGKGRRAAMEAACLMNPRPKSGDRVFYYIAKSSDGKKQPDWKRARPLEGCDLKSNPYDPDYYVGKLRDICERFSEVVPDLQFPDSSPKQGELFDL